MTEKSTIKERWDLISPVLNEAQRRFWLGIEAKVLGHGGVSAVAAATCVSRTTVRSGRDSMDAMADGFDSPEDYIPDSRMRKLGGGRKPLPMTQSGLVPALLGLVEPEMVKGYPSPLLWSTKGRAKLAELLNDAGFPVSEASVGDLLKKNGFRLKSTSGFLRNSSRPDNSCQFRFVSERAVQALACGIPVLGVELSKLVRTPALRDGDLESLSAPLHRRADFFDYPEAKSKSTSCGPDRNAHELSYGQLVKVDSCTVALVGHAVRTWWAEVGRDLYNKADRFVLVIGDLGDNEELMQLMAEELKQIVQLASIDIEVLHLPLGTFRWRMLDHQYAMSTSLFGSGRDLNQHEVLLEIVASKPAPRNPGSGQLTKVRKVENIRTPIVTKACSCSVERLGIYGTWNYIIRSN